MLELLSLVLALMLRRRARAIADPCGCRSGGTYRAAFSVV